MISIVAASPGQVHAVPDSGEAHFLLVAGNLDSRLHTEAGTSDDCSSLRDQPVVRPGTMECMSQRAANPSIDTSKGPQSRALDRRRFLARTGAAVAASPLLPLLSTPSPAQDAKQQFLETLGKHRGLIVHNTRPGVIETPMELLRKHRLTPKELLFIRNNQVLPGALTLDPHRSEGWTLELTGLIRDPRTIRYEQLSQVDPVEVEAVLQCSGNGRSFYARSVQTRGTQWARGGMGNVRWRGAPLKQLLESVGIEVDANAKFLTAEGKDPPLSAKAADFEHSVPLGDVLETALLATHMNGEPIPALHGGPLRLVIPGYYGTMNIKWLSRLRFEAQESENRHHHSRYRTFVEPVEPGSVTAIDAAANTPTWRQKIKSIIWNPVAGQTLQAGRVEVSGVAWNDGATNIEAVEVSVDRGRTWHRAEIEDATSRYAWSHWKATVQLAAGEQQIWARTIDALGRGQPLDGAVHWNPSGYEWYGVDKLTVNVA